jgi:hypothetical protein
MMHFADALLIAGICVILACAFLLGTVLWAAWRSGGQELRRTDDRGRRQDLYLGAVWSGMLLVEASSIFRHIEPGGSYNLSSLTVAATAGEIFVCGVFAGRLLLRREMRWYKEKRPAQSRVSN